MKKIVYMVIGDVTEKKKKIAKSLNGVLVRSEDTAWGDGDLNIKVTEVLLEHYIKQKQNIVLVGGLEKKIKREEIKKIANKNQGLTVVVWVDEETETSQLEYPTKSEGHSKIFYIS